MGTAAVGTATTFARSDHVHPMPTCVACAGCDGTGHAFGTAARCAATAFRASTWTPTCVACAGRALALCGGFGPFSVCRITCNTLAQAYSAVPSGCAALVLYCQGSCYSCFYGRCLAIVNKTGRTLSYLWGARYENYCGSGCVRCFCEYCSTAVATIANNACANLTFSNHTNYCGISFSGGHIMGSAVSACLV